MGTVGWHGSSVFSSFSLLLGYIVRPICGRVYPNDGHAVENQVERNTTGQMALVNVNGEFSLMMWDGDIIDYQTFYDLLMDGEGPGDWTNPADVNGDTSVSIASSIVVYLRPRF